MSKPKKNQVQAFSSETGTSLAPYASYYLHGGYVAKGVGLRDSTSGTITISGIPTGATVYKALLVWGFNSYGPPGDAGQDHLTFDGTGVVGALAGTGGDTCWSRIETYTYRADVTSHVTGDGSYTLTDVSAGPAQLAQGASLIVVYRKASEPRRNIVISTGNDVLRQFDTTMSNTFAFAKADGAEARTTFVMGDGQSSYSELGSMTGTGGNADISNSFDGSDGNYWDTDTYDVTSIIGTGGQLSATIGGPGGTDCLQWSAQIVSVTTNASGIPLEQTFGSFCNCFGSPTGYQHLTPLPVNTATGALYESFTDVAFPGAGTQLVFTRSYNSLDNTSGPMGPGWTFGFNASLSVDPNSGDVTVRAEDGKQAIFRIVSGVFEAPPGVRSQLEALSGGGFRLTEPDQSILEFDASGHLTAMKDRLGVGLTLAYTAGKLSSITDAAGRELNLTYTADLLTRLALADGRHVDYGYTSGLLTSVTDMRGKTMTYAYDTGGRLASALDPNGHYLFQNTYDANTGRVTSQLDGRGKQTTFSWNPSTQTATVTDPRGHIWSYGYSNNVLISTADPLGNTTTYGYDDQLNRTSITDPKGKVTTFTYDTAGNMLTKTGPAPSSVNESWTYTPFNAVETHTNGRGKTTSNEYFANQLLKKVTDPLGRATSLTWTAQGLLDTITDARGKLTDFGYDAAGNRTSVLSPEGNLTTFGYDGFGRKTSMVEARGNVTGGTPANYTTTYAYNADNQVTTVTDPLGHATVNAYDDAGNLATVTDADNKVTSYEHNADNQVTKVTDPRGGETSTTYDDTGNVASVTTPAGTTTFSYDDANRRTGEVTPRGNVSGADPTPFTWTYGYDANGNQTTVANPTAGTTTTTYDELNRPISTTDALGKITTTTYDADSNVASTTDPLNRVTGYGYDNADQPVSLTDPRNKTVSYGYDASGNRISQTSPLGNQRTWTYDGDGRMVTEIDPRGNAMGADPNLYKTVSAYDPAGHLLTVTDPEGHVTSYAYNRVGNLISRTDANSHVTSYGYDVVNRLTTVTGPANTGTTTYAYDAVGNLTSRTDANNHTTSYTYDLAGRLTQKTAPVNATTTQVWNYGYDPAGNLNSIETPAGSATTGDPNDGKITQSYDPVDRLTGIDYSDATQDVTYGYNALHRTSMTDGTGTSGTETYGYDDAGQLTNITRGTKVFTYSYDNDGRLTTRSLPDGRTITQAWDDDSRPASVSSAQGSATFGYDPAGDLTSTTFGNAVVETRGYDHTGWLTNVTAKRVNAVIAGHVIVRDNVGNPTDVTHTYNTSTTSHELFSYDNANRVTQVCFSTSCNLASKIVYTYDPVGNRLTEVRTNVANAGTITSTYNTADQLTSTHATRLLQSALDTTYGYDANGNQTSANDSDGGTRSYAYDLANRTTSATINGTATNYTYDGNGLRLSSTTGSAATTYTWDHNYPLPEMVDETTSAGARQFLNNPTGDPIAETNPGTGTLAGTFYYHPDGLGSIRAVTDANTTIRSTYAYEPFGTPRPSPTNNDTIPNPIRFASEYTDPNTGLSHLRARDYDPASGRFTGLDPLAQDIADPVVAAYVYASDRPTVLLDPSGMCPKGLGLVCKTGDILVDAGKNTWNATTNHASGCADRDPSECGGFFGDLISLGGIEGSVSDLSGCADRDLGSCGMLGVDVFTLGLGAGEGLGVRGACTLDAGVAGTRPAIGFAEGLGKSALTPGRLQHGTKNLTKAGVLPAWSGTKSPEIIRQAFTPILEHPTATFDHTLGDTRVRGFLGEVNGQQVVIFVYKEGPYQGQLASSFVPSANQLKMWGIN